MPIRFLLAASLLVACGGDEKSEPEPPPADAAPEVPLELAYPEAKLPPPAPAAKRTIGRGADVTYPKRVPLRLSPGLKAPSPPMRVQRVWPVPTRPLAVASGTDAKGPMIQLVDVDRGVIRWIRSDCEAPVVHTTADRIVCAAWSTIKGLEIDRGETLWTQSLKFRAAHKRYVLGRDPEDDKRASIVDAQSGKVVMELVAPANETFDEVERLCPGKNGSFDLFAWSKGGVFRRLSFSRVRGAESPGRRVWARRLPMRPAKVELCDPVMLIEVPIPGSAVRRLYALSYRNGNDYSKPIDELGWWQARGGDGIEVSTPEGIKTLSRSLEEKGVVSDVRTAGRRIASWPKRRLVRTMHGTMFVLNEQGVSSWIAAPVAVERAVITADRLLAGSWLVPPQTNDDTIALYELPASGSLAEAPVRHSGPSKIPEPKPQKVPPRTPRKPRAYPNPEAGTYAIGVFDLVGTRLHVVTLEGRPGPDRGSGLAVFDLATRTWLWHRDGACEKNTAAVAIASADGVVACAGRAYYPAEGVVSAFDADTGEPAWTVKLPTVDALFGAGSALVALYGTRAAVIDARDGHVVYEIESDNGHRARAVVLAYGNGDNRQTRVVAVEQGGAIVARDPTKGGAAEWSVDTRGYVVSLLELDGKVGVQLANGELDVLSPRDGSGAVMSDWSSFWYAPRRSDLVLDTPIGTAGVTVLRVFGLNGTERWRASYAITPPLDMASHRQPHADAPILVVSRRGEGRVIELDPASGRPRASYPRPPSVVKDRYFSAVIKGTPVRGAVLEKPATVLIF